MNEGKGEAYRVTPPREDSLVATVSSGGESYEGLPTEISIEGVALSFPQERAPTLPLGESLAIRFAAPSLREPLEVEGAAMLRVESLEDRSYRIQFHDTKDIESRLPSSLFQLFNRRASHRVSPDPEEPVPVIISPSEGSQTSGVARMEDISATGIGIFVEGGVESELAAVAAVQLSFGLPPRNQPIEIAGEIRRRQLGSDGVSYGVQFDASTLENSPTEDEILTYVMRRQREELAVRVQTRD